MTRRDPKSTLLCVLACSLCLGAKSLCSSFTLQSCAPRSQVRSGELFGVRKSSRAKTPRLADRTSVVLCECGRLVGGRMSKIIVLHSHFKVVRHGAKSDLVSFLA